MQGVTVVIVLVSIWLCLVLIVTLLVYCDRLNQRKIKESARKFDENSETIGDKERQTMKLN
jgi:hypothetical protein